MKKAIDLTKLSQAELISLLQQSQEREALLEQKVVKANGELAEVKKEKEHFNHNSVTKCPRYSFV